MVKKVVRRATGSSMADTPMMLWMLFILFFIPFLDLCTIGLRSTFLYMVAHNATITAAKAHSFQASVAGKQPAKTLAQNVAYKTMQAWSGVKLNSVTTQIVITDVATQNQTKQATPLSAPADNSLNTYQIEVTVDGEISPLITFNLPLFSDVPGLTKPISITMSDRQLCENPQGLNL